MPLRGGLRKEAVGLGVKFLGRGLKRLFVADRNYFLYSSVPKFYCDSTFQTKSSKMGQKLNGKIPLDYLLA